MAPELTCARCGAISPVGSRFCAACGASLGEVPREERRVVTVLFADVAGFTELSESRDPEEVKAIVDRTFEWMGEVVERFGGRVDNVIGDEMLAVFGAPVSHEDDPERAVRAALEIRRRSEEAGEEMTRARGFAVRLHIGINTGEVVAGFVGGSEAYTVLGDAVNTGRRIEEAADAGQILVGEWTYESTRSAIEYRRVGSVTAKGKRLPVETWEAISERGLPGERAQTAPLFGRDEELTLIESLSRIVRRDRRTAVVTIVGEAGMGKSRLAAEAGRRLASQGVRVLSGRALPYGTTSPAFAIEEMLRAALGIEQSLGGEDARVHLKERLDEIGMQRDIERVMGFFGLGGVPLQKRDGGSGAPGAAGAANPLLETAVNVLARVAAHEGMLVLAFHELHWADDAVLDTITSHLVDARAPILVLCLARPELLERRPGWGAGLGSSVLWLEPLPRGRAAAMLDALAPELIHSVRDSVLDRAGGNPFYLEELAGLLRAGQGEQPATVPVNVHALVAARLDALPAGSKRLLQDAAVVGEQFWGGALARLHEVDARALEPLVAQGFIESLDTGSLPGEDSYRFRQALVREVAYGSVPKHARAEAHAAVGGWLEEVSCACGREREFYDLLAHHYESAASLAREVGVTDAEAEAKAREYLVRAGDHAIGMDAALAAAAFFERALALGPEDDLAVRIRLGEALVGVQRHRPAEEHLARALETARATGARAIEAKALRLMADSRRMRGDLAGSREPLQRALQIAREIGDAQEEAAGLRSSGLLEVMSGRWADAMISLGEAHARYRLLDDARGMAWSLQNLGWASMLLGRLDEALGYLTEGKALFDDLGDEEGAGWCMGMRGWVLLMRGDAVEAGAIATELEHHLSVTHPEYAKSSGFVLELQRILRAYAAVALGRLGEADEIARSAVEGGEWADAGWAQSLGHYPILIVAILQRRFVAAHAALEAGSAAAAGFGDPFYIGLFRFGCAWLALEEGAHEEASAELDALEAHEELGRVWSSRTGGVPVLRAGIARARGRLPDAIAALDGVVTGRGLSTLSPMWAGAELSELHRETGDAAAAIDAARAALAEETDEVIGRVRAWRALAAAFLAAGEPSDAEEAARAGLTLLASADWEVERARALSLLAEVLDAQRRHDESAQAFDEARAIIESLPDGTDAAPLLESLRG